MLTFWPKQPHGRRDRSIWESTSCSSVIATCVQCHKMLFCLMILLEQRFKKWTNFAFYFISFSIIQYNNVQYVQCWKTYTSVNQVKNHSTVTWISHLKPKDMNQEGNFVYLVTVLDLLSPWCLAGCTSLKNKNHNIKNKVSLLLQTLGLNKPSILSLFTNAMLIYITLDRRFHGFVFN